MAFAAYCAMRAFVFFAGIAVVASGHRIRADFSSESARPHGRRALGAIVQVIKNAKPPAAEDGIKKAIMNGVKTVKPQRLLAPQGLVPKVNVPRQNLALKNAILPAAEDGIKNAIMNGVTSSKPSSAVVGAVTRTAGLPAWFTGTAEGDAGISAPTTAHHEEPGLPQSLSDATQSDKPLAAAGQEGSGIVKIAGVDIQFGTEAAKAAIESMNWVPSSEDANKILKKLECWPGRPPCHKKREALDWVSEYIGSYKYSLNVARATRGEPALLSDKSPAECFDKSSVTTEKATGCAFEYGVALSAALALVEAPAKQPLFRGVQQPVDVLTKLEGLAGGNGTFNFGGVSSTSSRSNHAKDFMRRPGSEGDDVRVMYEIFTDKAKSVKTALGGKKRYKEEWEFVLPPGQNFKVVSVERKPNDFYLGDHYHVMLQD